MSRLDHHVASVQNKLALRRFVDALAWTALFVGVAVIVALVVWRFMGHANLPAMKWWLIAAGVCVVGAGVYALTRRPTAHEAAVAIDDKLALKEKFSTALFVRPLKDPFAQAAVRDAERTADNVQLQRQFPIAFPKVGYGALGVFALFAGMVLWYPVHHDASASIAPKKPSDTKNPASPLAAGQKVIEIAASAPPAVRDDPKIKAEIAALTDMLKRGKLDDPVHAQRKAQEALEDVQQALANEAEKAERMAMEQKKVFAPNFGDPKDYKTEEGKKVDEALAKADFNKAAEQVGKMTENFDKKSEEEKAKAAHDAAELAKKLEAAATDPKVQQQIQQQAQKMGMSRQQAQQLAQQMQQAAQGDKAAQQQVAQAAQQMQQQVQKQMQQLQQQAQAGNQQAQQQLQQIQQQANQVQQAMKSMQGQANAQQQAQQMSQAAQQMAQAMQQQQQAQANAQSQGSKQGSQASQQQMQQAQAQMQQAMQSMQAGQSDAENVRASQQQAMKDAGDGQGEGGKDGKGGQGGQGENSGQPQPGSQAKGEFKTGEAEKQGSGSGGAGVSAGGKNNEKAMAGFTTKVEHDIGTEREDGKILASTLIKDNHPIKGQAKLGLAQITESTQKQASDEVDEDHVSGESRKAAEEYFRTMHQDAAPASK